MPDEPPRTDLAFTPAEPAPKRIPTADLIAPPWLTPLFLLGVLLLLVGLGMVAWYWLMFDTAPSHPVGYGDASERALAHDIQRLSERLAGLVVGGISTLLGALLVLFRVAAAAPPSRPPADNPFADVSVAPTT